MTSHANKGAAVGIPPRLLKFPLPEHAHDHPFFNQNVLASSMLSVMSAIFPSGERFFMESVRHFRDQIEDPVLKAQISGFIGQEAIHGREHEHLNEWFVSRGYDIGLAESAIKKSLGLLNKLPPSQRLACTVMMEHFTAILAEQWLTHDEFRDTSDPQALQLWTWHALEELEHKSVAFDVHRQVSQNLHFEKLLAAPLVFLTLTPGVTLSWLWVVYKQGHLLKWKENKRGFLALFGRQGFMTQCFKRIPEFFPRNHHPTDSDTRALEDLWRKRLFGEGGELNHLY